MAEYIKKTWYCKSNSLTKLYKQPYDTDPSTLIMQKGVTFHSNKQRTDGAVTLYHVSTVDDENNRLFIGYWIPENTIMRIPVEDTAQDDTSPDTEVADEATRFLQALQVNEPGVLVYAYSDSTDPITNGLAVGDILICDQQLDVVIDNNRETRCHIIEVKGDDQTVIGLWVMLNRSVAAGGSMVNLRNTKIVSIAKADSGEGSKSFLSKVVSGVKSFFTGGDDDDGSTQSGKNGQDDTDFYDIEQEHQKYSEIYNTTHTLMNVPIGRMLFVHGMPFQWTYITDRRNNGTGVYAASQYEDHELIKAGAYNKTSPDMYGRTFAREIAGNMPVATITPGRPKFLTAVSTLFGGKNEKNLRSAMLTQMQEDPSDEAKSMSAEELSSYGGDYNYYSIQIDTSTYFSYVNSLCRTSARLMGIGGLEYHQETLWDLNWGKYNSAAEQDYNIFERINGVDNGVSFAFDPESSVSDSISNTTTESRFTSLFNNASALAREVEFALGYSGSDAADLINSADYATGVNAGFSDKESFLGLGNAYNRIKTWMNHTIHGANIRFPEIWSDSTHSPSYEIDMHFITPYATQFCKWRYVLVPFFHVFALAAPKSDDNISNYSSPFLIRAFSKGFFNVEMGMIESLQWKRFGDGSMISQDGVPLQIDVTIGFKDMYHTLSMTSINTNRKLFYNNTGLTDLIGTLSGVNMNRLDLKERAELFVQDAVATIKDLPSTFVRSFQDRMRNTFVRWNFRKN